MLTYLLIMLGGALGSGARFWVAELFAERYQSAFPIETLFVNITGSFVIGFVASLADSFAPVPANLRLWQFVMIGICGGYTTFSAFSLQTLELMRGGDWWRAGLYSVLSLVCCLAAVWLGRGVGWLVLSR